jgi:hypothetical protein
MAIVGIRAAARWLARRTNAAAGRTGDDVAVLDGGDALLHAHDPVAALRALRERLPAGGVLRVRALPRWTHARDAQLVRVATLLGADAATRVGLSVLRRVVARLAPAHPLRFAFAAHRQRQRTGAWGRTCSATELVSVLAAAGLRPVRWRVPDDAEPRAAATRLRLQHLPDALVLDHVDLWQQLRAPLAVDAVGDASPPRAACWRGEADFLDHVHGVRVGARAPNPLYAHLFAAFELAARHPELELPDLEAQVGRWLPWATPLERGRVRFGLTPYATFQRFRVNVLEHLERTDLGVAADWSCVRLRDDDNALLAVRTLLRDAAVPAANELDDGTLRELHVLLQTHDRLFLTLR